MSASAGMADDRLERTAIKKIGHFATPKLSLGGREGPYNCSSLYRLVVYSWRS